MNDVLSKLLSLRPTNAAMRLGGSSLPLLNPRDLQRALQNRPGALLCAPAFSRAAVAGLLSAGRHEDAVIGVACPFPIGERDTPDAFTGELMRAAAEIAHTRPIFLQAGPFRLRTEDERFLETLSAQIFRYVEAGCSLVSLDGSSLELAAAAKVFAQLSQPARERELSVEVSIIRDPSGAPSAEDSARLLQTLNAVGVGPRYLRADVSTLIDDGALRTDRVSQLAIAAKDHGAELALEDPIGLDKATIKACVEAGARKWDAPEAFARKVAPALPQGALEALQNRASEVGRSWTELLGALSEGLAVEDDLRVRIEAFSYEEAATLISALGSRGSARAATAFLGEDAAY
ncbi:MAG: hypothetical protein ACJ790_15770 [Myxococcaceae bacterium]